jgi:hypothetical protein
MRSLPFDVILGEGEKQRGKWRCGPVNERRHKALVLAERKDILFSL